MILLFFIHYTFGNRSMYKTIEEAETHMAYRRSFVYKLEKVLLKSAFFFVSLNEVHDKDASFPTISDMHFFSKKILKPNILIRTYLHYYPNPK